MIYMLNIVYNPQSPTDPEANTAPGVWKLIEEMRESGHFRGGAGITPVEGWSRIVRHLGDEVIMTDGPFAESREALGGYFVVECSESEVLNYARRIPVDSRSHIEVRQIFVYNRD